MSYETLSMFWSQNYPWIIVLLVVLFLALIGFIAEKKNIVSFKKEQKIKVESIEIPTNITPVIEPVINVDGKQVALNKIERIMFEDEVSPKEIGEVKEEIKEIVPTFTDLNIPDPEDIPIETKNDNQEENDMWNF